MAKSYPAVCKYMQVVFGFLLLLLCEYVAASGYYDGFSRFGLVHWWVIAAGQQRRSYSLRNNVPVAGFIHVRRSNNCTCKPQYFPDHDGSGGALRDRCGELSKADMQGEGEAANVEMPIAGKKCVPRAGRVIPHLQMGASLQNV